VSDVTLYVNGRRLFVRGGNWGMSDAMLRLDDEGYDTRVRLHKEENFTMIRNWIGMTGSESFYRACDKYGILIWDDFWLANPADGPDPNDPALFMSNARDKILRVRKHPSLALYCARNEGEPPASVASDLQTAVQSLDGTRPYITNSAGGGVDGRGPYSVRDPVWYFQNNGPKIHSEIGLPNVPSVESMRAMMPAASLWPVSETWGLHDFCDSAAGASSYTSYVSSSYGAPTGIDDYCVKAQMVNMENYKAIFEGYAGAHRNGALLWMSQSAWPSTVWQTFDYYLEPTAAYFGAKHACEPLHVLWDASSNAVKVTNNSGQDYTGLNAEAKVYNLDGSLQYTNTATVASPADSVTTAFTIAYPSGLSPTHFVRLKLTNGTTVVSDNFYWRGNNYKDYTALSGLPMVTLAGSATRSTTGTTHTVTATVNNAGSNVALMVRLKLLRAASGERVLPTFYSDNYFSLLPSESKQVTLEFDDRYLAGDSPKLMVEAWNVASAEIAIP
jgi:beta-galactosidase/beta-glucuronidase